MHTRCAGFSKTGTRYRVPGSGYLAPGTRDPVPDQRRGPDTEHREPSRKANLVPDTHAPSHSKS
jgi:hypothetical protein